MQGARGRDENKAWKDPRSQGTGEVMGIWRGKEARTSLLEQLAAPASWLLN
jgi:hypothetical protein